VRRLGWLLILVIAALVAPAAGAASRATVVDVVEVRGQSATRTFEPRSGTTSVHWIEPAGAVVLDGYRGCVGASGVDLDTLTRIAQGLR